MTTTPQDPRVAKMRHFEGFDFITSDLHFGHKNQAARRGFTDALGVGDPDEHDEVLIDRWNSVVLPEDVVIVLGDIYLGRWAQALEKVADLNGHKHLILGNHDHPHPINKGKKVDEHLEVFETVSLNGYTHIAGRKALLSHFPYKEDHTDAPRYMEHRLPDQGEWLIHGHTHDPDQRLHDGREIHVGLDAWGLVPVVNHTITGIMKGAS